ncbi:hypothetical protein ACFLQR_01640, partial [Verrucomicrobiota bacterium]
VALKKPFKNTLRESRLAVAFPALWNDFYCHASDLKIRERTASALPSALHCPRLNTELLQGDQPVLGVLREGRLLLDMLTVFEQEIPQIAKAIAEGIAGDGEGQQGP